MIGKGEAYILLESGGVQVTVQYVLYSLYCTVQPACSSTP
jgi:hypothetical protein